MWATRQSASPWIARLCLWMRGFLTRWTWRSAALSTKCATSPTLPPCTVGCAACLPACLHTVGRWSIHWRCQPADSLPLPLLLLISCANGGLTSPSNCKHCRLRQGRSGRGVGGGGADALLISLGTDIKIRTSRHVVWTCCYLDQPSLASI